MRDRSPGFGNKHISRSHNKSILRCKDTAQRTQSPKHRKVNPDDPVIHIAHLSLHEKQITSVQAQMN